MNNLQLDKGLRDMIEYNIGDIISYKYDIKEIELISYEETDKYFSALFQINAADCVIYSIFTFSSWDRKSSIKFIFPETQKYEFNRNILNLNRYDLSYYIDREYALKYGLFNKIEFNFLDITKEELVTDSFINMNAKVDVYSNRNLMVITHDKIVGVMSLDAHSMQEFELPRMVSYSLTRKSIKEGYISIKDYVTDKNINFRVKGVL